MIEELQRQVNAEFNEVTIKRLQENEKALKMYAERYQMEVSFTEGTLYIQFTTADGVTIATYGFNHAVGEYDPRKKR